MTMASPGITLLRTCIACRRTSEPITLANINDFEAMKAFWKRLATDGWRTDSRGNQRCRDCPENYPPSIGSLEHGVPVP